MNSSTEGETKQKGRPLSAHRKRETEASPETGVGVNEKMKGSRFSPAPSLKMYSTPVVEREAAEENHNDQEEDGGDDPMEEEEEEEEGEAPDDGNAMTKEQAGDNSNEEDMLYGDL